LLKLLQEFEGLFDGTLGDWDCNPVSLQLKGGAQPYHGRPFPIPKKHVESLKKETQRLCNFRVLNWQADSEWALPAFIIPNKTTPHGLLAILGEKQTDCEKTIFDTQHQHGSTRT
jgi:hypothetical protein